MRKSRVFIVIAALLVTLLMVVGCDVSPVSPTNNNELVKASVAVSGSRDLQVVGGDGTVSSYKIAMIPEWSESDLSDPIVGRKGSRADDGVVTFVDVAYTNDNGNIEIDLGYVSQGKWSIYINAYNSSNVLIYSGNVTTYLNSSNSDIVIYMSRASEESQKGYLGFYIQVNQLKASSTDYMKKYGLKYDVLTVDGNSVLPKDANRYLVVTSISDDKNTKDKYAIYGLWDSTVSFVPDDYCVTVSLVINPKTENEEVIGGITKLVSIYPCDPEDHHSWVMIHGEVSPSDFIQVGIDLPAPDITASLSSSVSDGVYTFTCEDTFDNISGYVRSFRWFIDGELIEGTGDSTKWTISSIGVNSTAQNISSMSCSFKKLGDREIRCEVVYVPENIADIDNKPLHFVGGDTAYVQVLSV